MVFEATEFSVLGIKLSSEDILKFKDTFWKTYKELEEHDPKWKDVNFCKRQIGNLWDAVVDMLERFSEELTHGKHPMLNRRIRGYLLIGKDNEHFLEKLGEHSEGLIKEIAERFKETLTVGSIHARLHDFISNTKVRVKINPSKIMQKIKRESERVRKMLQQFVEWAKGGGRPIITCMLAAGLFTIALIAGAWTTIVIPATKPFIMATIAIICWVAETAGMVKSVSALKDLWRWRNAGISIEVE